MRLFHAGRTWMIFWQLAVLLTVLCVAQTVFGNKDMPDDEKIEAVYRMYAGYKKDFPAVEDISPQQAAELLNQGMVVFIDTRKPEEMTVSALPGAVSPQEYLNHRDRFKNKTAVSYCTISYRSGVFAREMAQQDITVVNLRGGILAWILEGGKVYDQNGNEVRRVHVYGDQWDYAPAGYESVTFSLWKQIF
jgi:sodium/bile acid cotransporter 7